MAGKCNIPKALGNGSSEKTEIVTLSKHSAHGVFWKNKVYYKHSSPFNEKSFYDTNIKNYDYINR